MDTNKIIKIETTYMALAIVILCLIMQAIFLILQKWDYTVLLGSLLSGSLVVLNFYVMSITVKNSLEKDKNEAKTMMKVSQSLRSFFFFVVLVAGVLLPVFNTASVLIPVVFPRIAIAFRPLIKFGETKDVIDQ